MRIALQVRKRGTLTLPMELRKKYDIETGDTFYLVDLDGVFVLTPMAPVVPELAKEIEQERLRAGLEMDTLLLALREQREQYTTEGPAHPGCSPARTMPHAHHLQ